MLRRSYSGWTSTRLYPLLTWALGMELMESTLAVVMEQLSQGGHLDQTTLCQAVLKR